MAIGNLSDRVSSRDIQRVNDMQNPPEFEPGFDGGIDVSDSIDNDSFDSLFGDSNDSFGGSDLFGNNESSLPSDGFNNNGFNNNGFNNNGFGTNNSFGNNNGLGSVFGNVMGNEQNIQQQINQPDNWDKAIDSSIEGAKVTGVIIKETIKSFKNRTADDVAYLGRNLIITGASLFIAGLLFKIIWALAGFSFLGSLLTNMVASGLIVGSFGIISMGASALWIEKNPDAKRTLDDIPNIEDSDENITGTYEDNIDDVLDELFEFEDDNETLDFGEETEEDGFNTDFDGESEDEFSLGLSDDFDDNDDNNDNNDKESNDVDNNTEINFEDALSGIQSNQIITREILFNTFKTLLVKNTPEFADRTEIDKNSDEFKTYQTVCIKALANAAKKELEEINTYLESVYETYFSLELRVERVKGISKTDDIARELEFYLRENADDDSVTATVDIEGDFYRIVVTKGESAIITLGDALQNKEVCNFFLNNKNKLPIIIGIDKLGRIVKDDAKLFDTMMIAGKPRSGKSWFVLSAVLQMMMFNTPSVCEFIIIDPKKSTLFKTLALMPHVIGLHDDSNVLGVLQDIIDNEGERRKKLLNDNNCDNIWDLREMGIELPILYVIIDEVITIQEGLGQAVKEFNSKLKVLISQLPYVGIRLLFVPHRATGVVDKTTRTMLQFTASVKGDNDDVKDTLGIDKWKQRLVNMGDTAIKTSNMKEAIYARGCAVTTSDVTNTKFIKTIASAFYKMGVDIPENVSLQEAYNRDEDYIREQLQNSGKRVQFNLDDD